MSFVTLECPKCSKPFRVDTQQLPDQPVLIKCPSCGSQVTVEKSRLLGAMPKPTAPAAPKPAPPAAPKAAPPAAPPKPPAAPARAPAPAPSPRPRPAPVGAAGPGKKNDWSAKPFLPPFFEIPPGAEFPPGVLVAEDAAAMQELRSALEPYKVKLQPMGTLGNLAEIESMPPLVACVLAKGAEPSRGLEVLRELPPKKRRRIFVLVVCDTAPTLDGQQAFLHEVDLILNKADIDVAPEALFLALETRRRLWGPLLGSEDEMSL